MYRNKDTYDFEFFEAFFEVLDACDKSIIFVVPVLREYINEHAVIIREMK